MTAIRQIAGVSGAKYSCLSGHYSKEQLEDKTKKEFNQYGLSAQVGRYSLATKRAHFLGNTSIANIQIIVQVHSF